MQIRELFKLPFNTIENLLRSIPFYKEIQQQDAEQFERLLKYSKLVDLEPGDTIMRSGDQGSWLYFLLKGQLAVFLDESDNAQPLNYIRPGELFGDLAMLSECERRATVRADVNCKSSLLFATNFDSFGELEDFSIINLDTKLVLYRMMVHSVRWKLELNKMDDPSHELVDDIRKITVYTGPKSSLEELRGLSKQAQQLADLLIRWNTAKSAMEELVIAQSEGNIDKQILDDIA